MTSSFCPTCGRPSSTLSNQAQSNARRDLTVTIPEEHFFLFKMIFERMNIKFGMMGLGEFANLMPSYQDKLPIDQNVFRFFNDVKLTYLFLSINQGYHLTTKIEPGGTRDFDNNERMKVAAILTPPSEGEPIEMTISDGVAEPLAQEACAYLQDAFQRLSTPA